MVVKLYEFRENDVYIKAEEHTLIALAKALRDGFVKVPYAMTRQDLENMQI